MRYPDILAHPLARYGWDEFFADGYASYADHDTVPARILRVDRGRCDAVTERGTVPAVLPGPALRDPTEAACTGDWCALVPEAGGGWAVRALLPRRTAFLRSTASTRSDGQVLAANVDVAIIVVSLAVALDPGRLERFISLAWASGAEPLVALTKADLAPDTTLMAADARAAAPGAEVMAVSADSGAGIDALSAALVGRTSVLIGQSGAGKSTLANALLCDNRQSVHAIRDRDGKGRHTTTSRHLLPLPAAGVLIDTPGLRGVGLWDAEAGVAQAFAEIEALASHCRFGDCAHGGEPGCAVWVAIEDGQLPERRLSSFRKLLREQRSIAARTQVRLRAEIRRESKRNRALGRAMREEKRGQGRNR